MWSVKIKKSRKRFDSAVRNSERRDLASRDHGGNNKKREVLALDVVRYFLFAHRFAIYIRTQVTYLASCFRADDFNVQIRIHLDFSTTVYLLYIVLCISFCYAEWNRLRIGYRKFLETFTTRSI